MKNDDRIFDVFFLFTYRTGHNSNFNFSRTTRSQDALERLNLVIFGSSGLNLERHALGLVRVRNVEVGNFFRLAILVAEE